MLISIIVAMDRNRCIGRDGRLPWSLPSDLQRFKQLTMGHSLLMGRKTYQSIGRALPGRTTYILSRTAGFSAEGCQTFTDIDAAVDAARAAGESELFVCGGAEIYRQTIPLCQRIYLTELEREVAGDAFFPEILDIDFQRIKHLRLLEMEPHLFSLYERMELS